MAYGKKIKETAQRLFCNTSLTMKDIAEQIEIDPRTLSRWAKEGNWDDIRSARSVTRPELLKHTLAQINALNEAIEEQGGLPNKQQSDAKGVLAKELSILQREDPISTHVEILEGFSVWLSEDDLELAKKFAPKMLEYLQEKAKQL